MAIKKLFLCHHSGDAPEVQMLATELRLRGIVPWLDKDGGFNVGDHSPAEARRAIHEECLGLLLDATRDAFSRPFIRDVEIDEAKKVRRDNPRFSLFAVPRRLSFMELEALSLRQFGCNLRPYHTVAIPEFGDFDACITRVATEVLRKLLATAPQEKTVSLQFSTRDLLPDDHNDLLSIDATHLTSCFDDTLAWGRLLVALRDLKRALTKALGRPDLHVHGSKHLAAAFLFGRVFAPFELHIRQAPGVVWSTDSPSSDTLPFAVSYVLGNNADTRLFVEVASRLKNVAAGVDAFIASDDLAPALRLQFQPPNAPLEVDNALCLAMVRQIYTEIERAMQQHVIDEVHVFAAAPQSFMMMLGRAFRGMPPTCLYEWSDTHYVFACRVPGGVL